MIALDQATALAEAYRRGHGATWIQPPPEGVVDRPSFWFLPVGFIGSCGVAVDKADGRLHVFGSSLPLEEWLWGHEHGFTGERQVLTITAVNDLAATAEFLEGLQPRPPLPVGDPAERREAIRRWHGDHGERARLQTLKLAVLPHSLPAQPLWAWIPSLRKVSEEGHPFRFRVMEASP
jgi:hypothetical protein